MNTLPPRAELERAYLARDPAYDGLFIVGVRTTGIFCRPTCPVRSPRPENVEFFPSAATAVFAGYRACKRCRPLAVVNQPDWAAALVERIDAAPAARVTEKDLRALGVDPATVRRHFVRHYGMTFQAYTRARRLAVGVQSLQTGATVDAAAFATGYESVSGFREAFGKALGRPPGDAAGRDPLFPTWLPSPLGPLLAGATAEGLCLLEFTGGTDLEAQLAATRRVFDRPPLPGTNPHLDRLRAELDAYFAGTLRAFTVPLVYPGTPFQRRVWDELQRIPYGETRSYRDVADATGDAKAVRAVGRANGMNRICIVIPCHRVVNTGGALGGYAGGLRRKQYLLNLEQLARERDE